MYLDTPKVVCMNTPKCVSILTKVCWYSQRCLDTPKDVFMDIPKCVLIVAKVSRWSQRCLHSQGCLDGLKGVSILPKMFWFSWFACCLRLGEILRPIWGRHKLFGAPVCFLSLHLSSFPHPSPTSCFSSSAGPASLVYQWSRMRWEGVEKEIIEKNRGDNNWEKEEKGYILKIVLGSRLQIFYEFVCKVALSIWVLKWCIRLISQPKWCVAGSWLCDSQRGVEKIEKRSWRDGE